MAAVQADSIEQELESVSVRLEQLNRSYTELKNHRTVIADSALNWTEIEAHFADINEAVKCRIDELRNKEQAFESKLKELEQGVDSRESVVSEKEKASLARIQAQRDLAVAAILDEKHQWSQEKQTLNPKGLNVTLDEQAVFHEDIDIEVKRESAVAVEGSIGQSVDVESSQVTCGGDDDSEDVVNLPVSETLVRPKLMSLCKEMDGDGLRGYLVELRKHIGTLRTEMPAALHFAVDPARLVLRALEGYPPPENGGTQANGKSVGASGLSRVCILLMESLAIIWADSMSGKQHSVVSPSIREAAKAMADKWKSKMDSQADPGVRNHLDTQAFLQLLVTFDLTEDYDADELCNLVLSIAERKQTPQLCKSLGLAAKVPGIVDKLSIEGKVIEALAFAHAFGFIDTIQPVPLLKGYLKEERKTAESILTSDRKSLAAQTLSTLKELSASKAVTRCIEEYKLEAEYPSAPIQRRIAYLEKVHSDRKKRVAANVKPKPKRRKGIGATGTAGFVVSVSSDKGLLRVPARSQYTGAGLSPHVLPPPYDMRISSSSGPAHAGIRSPVPLSTSYPYSPDVFGAQVYGPSAYANPPTSHGSYHFGSVPPQPPWPPAYQHPFLH